MTFWVGHGAVAVLLLLGSAGSIIGDEKCDAHQVELNKDGYSLCVCEPGAVINPSGVGCTVCGPNEEVLGDACVCSAGYARLTAEGGCEKSEIGSACSAESDCPATFPYCTGAGGYCTSRDCTANADCPTGWSCEAAADARYCKKGPTGLGVACESSADCAQFEASTCDLFQTHTCMMMGCAVGDVSCPNEWGCCDFSALLGSPMSACLIPESLSGGMCPFGGSLVTP